MILSTKIFFFKRKAIANTNITARKGQYNNQMNDPGRREAEQRLSFPGIDQRVVLSEPLGIPGRCWEATV